jgi:hypothetical protein
VQIPRCEGFVQGGLNAGLEDNVETETVNGRLHVKE